MHHYLKAHAPRNSSTRRKMRLTVLALAFLIIATSIPFAVSEEDLEKSAHVEPIVQHEASPGMYCSLCAFIPFCVVAILVYGMRLQSFWFVRPPSLQLAVCQAVCIGCI